MASDNIKVFFPWDEKKYSVGIKEIDEQHKILVNMLNMFYTAFMEKRSKDVIGDLINKLKDYSNYHFRSEEKLFLLYNYSETASHKGEHLNFEKKIQEFYDEYQKNSGALTYKMMIFLKEWLNEHILINDKKYAKEFKNKKIFPG